MANDVHILDMIPLTSYRPSLAAILIFEESYVQVGRTGPGCRRRWYHWLRFREVSFAQPIIKSHGRFSSSR